MELVRKWRFELDVVELKDAKVVVRKRRLEFKKFEGSRRLSYSG
jgi:hypothetical protein